MNSRARDVQYRRHFARAQRATLGFLRDTSGVGPFIRHAAVARDQRIVKTVRTGVIADVKVGPELRRREMELAADRVVAHTNRQQHEGTAHEKRRCFARTPLGNHEPQQDRDREKQCVLTRQRKQTEHDADDELSEFDPASHQAQQRGSEESDERGLLQKAIKEDRRRVDRQQHTCDRAPASEQRHPCRREEYRTIRRR